MTLIEELKQWAVEMTRCADVCAEAGASDDIVDGNRKLAVILRRAAERIAALEAEVRRLRDLVSYAAESSTVTTSDDPGCFWCDHVEHTKDCPAAKALGGAAR